MVLPATVVAATRSASDTNFRRSKENGSACSCRGCNDLPRPILIFVAAEKNGSACYGRGGNGFPRTILIFVAAKRMVSPATAVAATRSASDSNLRRCKENGFACYGRGGNGFPRPILIFVAAKRMVPPATAVATTVFRVRY